MLSKSTIILQGAIFEIPHVFLVIICKTHTFVHKLNARSERYGLTTGFKRAR